MNEAKITFCGDFVIYSPQNVIIDESILSILHKSDLSFINFEAPISDVSEKPIAKSGPSISQNKDSIQIVKSAGFNIISLANNHIFDYGETAAKKTKQMFDGVYTLGLGKINEVYQVQIIHCNGYRIGFIVGCQREFGALDGDDKDAYGYAWINDNRIDKAINEARANCDYLFVCPHAGVEEVEIPLPEWRTRYRSLIEAGADAVIAAHPHIVQGYEDYKGKRIYYSLGNFYFSRSAMKECWYHGLMVTVTIDNEGLSYENHFVKLEDFRLHLDAERLPEFKRLNSLIVGEEYERQVNKLVEIMLPFYDEYFAVSNSSPLGQQGLKGLLSWLRRALKGYRDDLRLVNLMRCESHRWLYVRCLNKRCKNIY